MEPKSYCSTWTRSWGKTVRSRASDTSARPTTPAMERPSATSPLGPRNCRCGARNTGAPAEREAEMSNSVSELRAKPTVQARSWALTRECTRSPSVRSTCSRTGPTGKMRCSSNGRPSPAFRTMEAPTPEICLPTRPAPSKPSAATRRPAYAVAPPRVPAAKPSRKRPPSIRRMTPAAIPPVRALVLRKATSPIHRGAIHSPGTVRWKGGLCASSGPAGTENRRRPRVATRRPRPRWEVMGRSKGEGKKSASTVPR